MSQLQNQNWAMVGSAPASQTIWGIREIAFPSGYCLPTPAVATSGSPLMRSKEPQNIHLMGGLALEIGKRGFKVGKDSSGEFIAGLKPWIGLYGDFVLTDLAARKGHSIMMWDKGVDVFYGLWLESAHSYGSLIPWAECKSVLTSKVTLSEDDRECSTAAASDYYYAPETIVPFMTSFVTLDPGDTFILGPLVTTKLAPGAKSATIKIGPFTHSVQIVNG